MTKRQIENTTSLQNDERGEEPKTAEQYKEGFHNFQRVFYNAVDPVFLISGQRFFDCNDAAVVALEAENKLELLSMHPSEFSPVDQPDGENSFDKANRMIHLALENGFHRFDWVHKKRTGELFSVEVSLTAIELDGQPILHALWKDLTVPKTLEESLRTALHKAENANQMTNQFLSQISHELREPLNAILGFAQLLEIESEHTFNRTQNEYILEILRGGRNLLGMVDELLDLSSLETDTIELQLEEISVQRLIADSIKIAKSKGSMSADLTLVVEPMIENIDLIYADYDRTRQILVNLISNAIKYTKGKGEVVIKCREMPDGMLRISVKDSGCATSAISRNQEFDPLSAARVDMGLAISRNLVKLMSGRMGFISSEKPGSTFWIELPIIAGQQKKFSKEESSQAVDLEVQGKVLYIEDNLANAALMKNFFAGSSAITFLSAEDAEEGIEKARKEQPDLILLDIYLPGIDGWEALKILKTMPETKDIPVVAVSASASDEDIARGKVVGFTDYLAKPVDFDKLTDIVNSIV